MKNSQIGGWARALAFVGSIVAAVPALCDVESTDVQRGPLAYITRFDGGGISVLDTSTEQEIAVLAAQSPEGVAMAPGGRPVYVADYGAGRLLVIDDTDGTPQIAGSIAGLLHPRAVVATPDGRKVFVGTHEGRIIEVDARTRTIKGSYQLSAPNSIFGLAVTPDSQRLIVTTAGSAAGMIHIFDTDFLSIGALRSFFVPSELYSAVISQDGRYAIVPAFRGTTVYFVELSTLNTYAKPVGFGIFGVAVNPTNGLIYATTLDDHVVWFSPNPYGGDGNVVPIPVGVHPQGLSFTPDGTRLYVANEFSNSVSIIDPSTNKVVQSISVPGGPVSLGQFIAPTGRSIEITEFYNTTLNHYFRTANVGEATGIDAGAAGPGWVRTNLPFRAWATRSDAPLNAVPVCRFYGTPGRGPNSHFYTSSATECSLVKRDPGWTYEGIAFFAVPILTDATCPTNLTPIWRTYNNDFAHNNSNHRMGKEIVTYQSMIAQKWLGEGTVMCGE